MIGTITQLERTRGSGVITGEDGKHYFFRRSAVHDVWFHELREGETVTFEAAKDQSGLHAKLVRVGQRA